MKCRRKKSKEKPSLIRQAEEEIQCHEKTGIGIQVKKKPPDKTSGKVMKRLVSKLYNNMTKAIFSNKKGIKLCDGNNLNTEVPSRLFKCVDVLMVMVRELCLLEEKLNFWLEGRRPHNEMVEYAEESEQR
jgi:hypothetical protein